MSIWCKMTLSKNVTGYGEIGRTKLGEIRRTEKCRKINGFSNQESPKNLPKFPQKRCVSPKNDFWEKTGENLGKAKKGCQV